MKHCIYVKRQCIQLNTQYKFSDICPEYTYYARNFVLSKQCLFNNVTSLLRVCV